MSEENVEVVREAWKAYSDQGIEGTLDYFAEDCIAESFPEAPDRETHRGWQGVRDRYRIFTEDWDAFVAEPVEFIDAGEAVVVAVVALRGSGRGSGTPLDTQAAFVYDIRDGKIVRDRPFTSRSQALEGAGLLE